MRRRFLIALAEGAAALIDGALDLVAELLDGFMGGAALAW